MKTSEIEKQRIADRLRKYFRRNPVCYTSLNHVSASGMTRHISVFVAIKNEIIDITWDAATLMEYNMNKKGSGMIVGGCGMDMGFHVVYSLSRCLYPKGFKLPKGKIGRNGDTSGFDADGGYKLKHKWL